MKAIEKKLMVKKEQQMIDTSNFTARAEKLLCENILPFWIARMADSINGGFYGRMTGEGVVERDAPKGVVLNARILWTFSAAYRIFEMQNICKRQPVPSVI